MSQPERIQGHSYTITSDVWSLGVTLLEVAQHRFPFGNEADSGGRAGLIDLLTYIVRQPIPELKDEPHLGIKWSDNFKYFIRCWYVLFGPLRGFFVHVRFTILTLFHAVLRRIRRDELAHGGC